MNDCVDDKIIKSKTRMKHRATLQCALQRCCENNFKLNLLKCAFCITSRHFFRFLVHLCDVQIVPTKLWAIIEITLPTSLRQLKVF